MAGVLGVLLIGLIYFRILDIWGAGYFPTLGLVGRGPGGGELGILLIGLTYFWILDIWGAGYFPTLG